MVNSRTTIGDWHFDSVVEIDINTSIETLTDTCTITLPRKVEWDLRQLALGDDPLIKRGMEVKIEYGYDGVYETEFIGFVRKIKSGTPVTIECDDSAWLLKYGSTFTNSYRSVNLKALLADLLPDGIDFKAADIDIGAYRISKVTPAQVLEDLKQRYGIYTYFRLIDAKPILYSGLAYWAEFRFVGEFEFGHNIIDHTGLEYRRREDIKVRVRAVSIKHDNTRIEVEVGDPDGELRTLHYFNLTEAQLRLFATQKIEKFKCTGYKGSFETFGEPSMQKGDIVKLKGDKYNPDGDYLISAISKQLGVTRGIRQVITIDAIVNDKRTNS